MHDADAQLQTMITNMKSKTGRSLPEWLALTISADAEKFGQLVKWLKAEHGVSHGYANLIASQTISARSGGAGSEVDLVDAQYAGAKTALRPILDAIAMAVQAFGDDVELAPKKTCVSLRRRKQFALVQPSTKTRVDLGINLPGTPTTARLEASGSFNAMVSHRVRLASPAEVDGEVVAWLRAAYDAAG
ncbi:MAG TPA: DUF5655 domain-containing protein [Pseudomonadales bacterium]|nr:DUF5655 domain-containing protein [Pseudomonadales bacterium]